MKASDECSCELHTGQKQSPVSFLSDGSTRQEPGVRRGSAGGATGVRRTVVYVSSVGAAGRDVAMILICALSAWMSQHNGFSAAPARAPLDLFTLPDRPQELLIPSFLQMDTCKAATSRSCLAVPRKFEILCSSWAPVAGAATWNILPFSPPSHWRLMKTFKFSDELRVIGILNT